MAPRPALQKAQKSTGPRTSAGKVTSSRNSLKHGLASGTVLMPGEDPAQLAALEKALLAQYTPATPMEELLVIDMAKHHWLKDRALRLQGEALCAANSGELPASFPVLLRYQNTNERAFHKALATLLAIQLATKKDARTEAGQFVSQDTRQQIMDQLFTPLPEPPLIASLRKKFLKPENA